MINRIKPPPSLEMNEWLRSPATEAFIKYLEATTLRVALETLLGHCASTDDANVARAYADYLAIKDMTAFLRDGRKESLNDD